MARGRMAMLLLAAVVVCVLLQGWTVHASGSNHKYGVGDPVPLYANKVGPFHNPRSVKPSLRLFVFVCSVV